MHTFATQPVVLGRQVRFCLPPPGIKSEPTARPINNHAGFPAPRGVSPFYQITVELAGIPGEKTSCLSDIKRIDAAVRSAVPATILSCVAAGDDWPGSWLVKAWPRIERELQADAGPQPEPSLHAVMLEWTPFHRLTVGRESDAMVYLTEQFEFSAAHRLWSDRLSAEDNHRAFGKCANPASHGHNYVFDVTIAADGPSSIGQLEQVVNDAVIAELDHRNLNVDCPDFASVNPTVENICRFIWQRLSAGPLGQLLHSVRVYETPKTYAECRQLT